MKVDICLVVISFLTLVARVHSDEVCLPVKKDGEPQPHVSGIQGRPGKLGPTGLTGPKGEQGVQGPPGDCVCDLQEVEELREQVQSLSDKIRALEKTSLEPIDKDHQMKDTSNIVPQWLNVYACSVGVRDGRVLDTDMTASSAWSDSYRARYGRLDRDTTWIVESGRSQKGEWIQVDLKLKTRVTGVVTQGRELTRNGLQYVSSYKIMYGDALDSLETITSHDGSEKIFQGNTDPMNYAVNTFPEPVTARYFRLVVESWNVFISLRMDYITC